MTGETKIALVAGANGIIGKALMEELAAAPGWRARALSRRRTDPRRRSRPISPMPEPTRAALCRRRDTTHLFYAASRPSRTLRKRNG